MMRKSYTPLDARRRTTAAAVVVGGTAAFCSLLAAAPASASAVSGPSPQGSVSLPATGRVGTPIVGSVTLPSAPQGSPEVETFTLHGPATFKAVTGVNVAACSVSASGMTATCTESVVNSAPSGKGWVVTIVPNAPGKVTLVGSTNGSAAAVTGSTTITAAAAPTAAPVVTGIAPTSGPTTGGTSVTVTGTGFTGATWVDFGTVPATSVTVDSDTSITATAPPSVAGTVDVTVLGTDGTSATSSADQYTYTASAPTVSAIFPHRGFAAGGRPVIIAGSGFTGATGVAFGSTAATSFTVGSDNYITAVAPAGTGTVDVTVTTPAGTSATSGADQYTYYPDRTRLVAYPTTVSPVTGGVSLNPSATLTDRVTGTPVAGQTIAFTVGLQPVCTAVTDTTGNAQCTGTLPQSGVPMLYAYRAEFAGTSTLAPSMAWGRLVGPYQG